MDGARSSSPTEDSKVASAFPVLRDVPWHSPFLWLARGVRDLRAQTELSLFFGFCYAAMGLAVTIVFEHAYQYTSALTSGFLLLGPFLAIGLYEISRRRERQEKAQFWATLTIWKQNAGNVGLFAAVLLIVFLVWARASLVVFALFYTNEMPNLTGFLGQIVSFENFEFLAVYAGVGLIFASLVFALSLVSIPLMLDRNQDAITAMLVSVGALVRNPAACTVWAALIVFLTLLGFLTFHIGLVFFMPIVGHATWHAYRDLVEPPAQASSSSTG